jgi:hypothetical protein
MPILLIIKKPFNIKVLLENLQKRERHFPDTMHSRMSRKGEKRLRLRLRLRRKKLGEVGAD